jgi:hypothetical protein
LLNVEPNPPGLIPPGGTIDLTDPKDHFVYDLSDDTYPDWTGFYPSLKIMKKAYSVSYARAKLNTESAFYDAKFTAKILKQNMVAEVVTGTNDQKSVLVANSVDFYPTDASTLLTGYGAVCTASSGTRLTRHTYVYTSPQLLMTVGTNARMGPEYSCFQNGFAMLETHDVAFLLRSPMPPTMASVYDACLSSSSIFDIVDVGNFTSVVERSVDDNRWAYANFPAPPQSDNYKFLIGEYPYKSDGAMVLLPPLQKLEMDVSNGNFPIPEEKLPVLLELGVVENGDASGLFRLYPSPKQVGKPAYEVSLGEIQSYASGSVNIVIPPRTYGSYSTGGGFNKIVSVKGCAPNTTIAGKLTPYVNDALTGDKATLSDKQVEKISTLEFPVRSNSVTATSDCVSGYVILGYETNDRIDLAFRSSHFGPFIPLRDVVLRIPNEDSSDGKTLPSAKKPVLMTDYNTRNMYLFFLYKNRLLVKKMPEELLADLVGTSETFSSQPEKEAEAIKRLHMLTSNVVFEGAVQDALILPDMRAGAVRRILDMSVPATSDSINEFCVFSDQIGYMYAAVQTEKQIYIMRSYDGGDVWENLIPDGFSFYPPKRIMSGETVLYEQNDPVESEANIPQYPYVMVDWPSQNGSFFYFVEDNLLTFQFPIEIFRGTKENIPNDLTNYIRPKLVVGKLTSDMIERGITYANPELTSKSPPIRATPQKVTGVMTQNGAFRVFFRDNNNSLASIISTNMSGTWLLDEDIKQ